MAWIYLSLAGLFECGWAVGLKYTDGFTRLWPSLLTAASMAVSLYLLALAMKSIPVVVLFGESREIMRIFSILLIVAGIIGLKLFSGPSGA
jgi:quaternary ammonium compound-resistance protein SugE